MIRSRWAIALAKVADPPSTLVYTATLPPPAMSVLAARTTPGGLQPSTVWLAKPTADASLRRDLVLGLLRRPTAAELVSDRRQEKPSDPPREEEGARENPPNEVPGRGILVHLNDDAYRQPSDDPNPEEWVGLDRSIEEWSWDHLQMITCCVAARQVLAAHPCGVSAPQICRRVVADLRGRVRGCLASSADSGEQSCLVSWPAEGCRWLLRRSRRVVGRIRPRGPGPRGGCLARWHERGGRVGVVPFGAGSRATL
ncbi:hypothetical protein EV647_3313 [Kribbella sp. VKM Ac-2566]|nr:hypothetical protein EV647_3313 [Kribbella sp. VKM Ac-2566]